MGGRWGGEGKGSGRGWRGWGGQSCVVEEKQEGRRGAGLVAGGTVTGAGSQKCCPSATEEWGKRSGMRGKKQGEQALRHVSPYKGKRDGNQVEPTACSATGPQLYSGLLLFRGDVCFLAIFYATLEALWKPYICTDFLKQFKDRKCRVTARRLHQYLANRVIILLQNSLKVMMTKHAVGSKSRRRPSLLLSPSTFSHPPHLPHTCSIPSPLLSSSPPLSAPCRRRSS
jgi:hypothetical protein